jgi:hypothetical protein
VFTRLSRTDRPTTQHISPVSNNVGNVGLLVSNQLTTHRSLHTVSTAGNPNTLTRKHNDHNVVSHRATNPTHLPETLRSLPFTLRTFTHHTPFS